MLPIKMTSLLNTLRYMLLATAATLALAACGPGTGGTGTGPIGVTLGFVGGSSNGNTTGPGASCVGSCSDVALRLDTERVELTTPCLQFVADGAWFADSAGLALIVGQIRPLAGTSTAATSGNLATLRLQFSAAPVGSDSVVVSLTDDTGRVLLAPLTLRRNDAPSASPGVCQAP